MQRFNNLGVIKNELNVEEDKLHVFEERIHAMLLNKQWNKEEIVDLFNYMMPNFGNRRNRFIFRWENVMDTSKINQFVRDILSYQ